MPIPSVGTLLSKYRHEIMALFKVLLPFLCIMAIIGYFHEFVYNAINANVAINGLIIAAAMYDVILIVMRLIGAQKDFHVIDRFLHEATERSDMRSISEEPWLKRSSVRHYLMHIAETGGTVSSQLNQNAIENELKSLSAEYEHKLELPQFIVGFMIAMGLLGTFIGLLETLTGIAGMLDGMGGGGGGNMDEQFMKLVVELRKPLAGMGIAFSASMFGLVTSLMLAIMMINLRRYIGHVVAHARNVMHELTKLIVAPTSKELAAASAGGGGGGGSLSRRPDAANLTGGEMALQDIVYKSHDANIALVAQIEILANKTDTILQAFEHSNQAVQKMCDMMGFGPRMKETNDKTYEEIKKLGINQLEQQKLSQRLIDIELSLGKTLEAIMGSEANAQTALMVALKDMGDKVLNIVNAEKEVETVLSNMIIGHRDAQANLAVSLKDLSEKLVNINDSSVGTGRHLWDIKEKFSKMGAYFHSVETISANSGRHALLLEALIKEDRELQKRLISIQQDIRERTLPSPTTDETPVE